MCDKDTKVSLYTKVLNLLFFEKAMLCKLRFIVFLAGAIVSVVESTNIKVVRQLNPDTNFPPFADSFSNQQCSSSSCPSRSTCAGGRCCMCQCLYDWPNVFVNRTSLKCMNYEEMNRVSSANCQYSFRGPSEPLEVIPLTTVATGKTRFRSNSAGVNCPKYGFSVDKWQFLDVDGRWQDGVGKVFGLEYAILVGPDGSKLLTLKWNAMLQPKYSGLIIRLLLGCAGRKVGCLLAKINGTYSFEPTPVTSPGSPPGPSAVTTPRTNQGTGATPVAPLQSTPGPTTTMAHTPESSLSPSAVVPETESRSTVKAPPESAEKKQLIRNGSTSKVIWPAVGAIAGLICLITLVCLIIAVYRRRKTRASQPPVTATEAEFADTDAKPATDKDPIYAEVQDKISDNPLYSQYHTPSKEQILKRSKLDPLPALPADEPICQPLIERPN